MDEARKLPVSADGQSRASYQSSLRQKCSSCDGQRAARCFSRSRPRRPLAILAGGGTSLAQKPTSKSGSLRRNTLSWCCFGEVEGRAEPARRCGCVQLGRSSKNRPKISPRISQRERKVNTTCPHTMQPAWHKMDAGLRRLLLHHARDRPHCSFARHPGPR